MSVICSWPLVPPVGWAETGKHFAIIQCKLEPPFRHPQILQMDADEIFKENPPRKSAQSAEEYSLHRRTKS
jgi:hypothetical protein